MLLRVETSLFIRAAQEAIWTFASDPDNWTASNPTEHFGLTYDAPDNRPASGVTFRQRESVAGVKADLRGLFLYVREPDVAAWTGIATYRILGGLFRPRVPEGGTVWLESEDDGVIMHHDVFMHFSDTVWGGLLSWAFRQLLHGEQAIYDHTVRELRYFKERLEGVS